MYMLYNIYIPIVDVLTSDGIQAAIEGHQTVHQPGGPHWSDVGPLHGMGVKAEAAG